MQEFSKIFKGEIIKISVFILSLWLALIYVVQETGTNFEGLLNFVIRNIKF